MKKLLLTVILFTAVLIGCIPNPSLSDADKTATIVTATLSAIPSPSSINTTLIYIDPDFGFKLQHDASWQMELKQGSGLTYNDGKGKKVLLKKDDYIFELTVMEGTGEGETCGGLFLEDPTSQYILLKVDDVELWRSKAEQGDVTEEFAGVSFVSIISPVELYEEPKTDPYITWWGEYTCQLRINNHGVRIQYVLPVSEEDLKAGNFNQELIIEMDNILTSLTWR